MRNAASLFLIAAVLVSSGCDFQAAVDAFDDVGVVVELPPINTVTTGQLLDATTDRPVSQRVNVTFSGEDASRIIDVYSDQVTQMKAGGGFFSFGVGGAEPTETDPVSFTITASADGYLTRTKNVTLFEGGTSSIEMRLVPTDPNAFVAGTAGASRRVATSNGVSSSATTIQTAPTSETQTSATLTIPQNTQALKTDGSRLNSWTVDMRYFDNSPASLQAVSDNVLMSPSGEDIWMLASVTLRFWDPQTGEVAAGLSDASGQGAGKNAGACAATFEFTVSPTTQAILNQLGHTTVGVYAVHGSMGMHSQIGSTEVVNGKATVCLTWLEMPVFSISGTTQITVGLLDQSRPAAATVSIAPNGHTGQVRLVLQAPGVLKQRTLNVTSGSAGLSTNMSTWGWNLPVIEEYKIAAISQDGDISNVVRVDPFQGSYSLALPQAPTSQIDVDLVLEPNCPAGQRVPFTGKLDGLTVNYQRDGGPLRSLPGGDLNVETTTTQFTKATGTLRQVTPNTTYTIYATLGETSSTEVITTPSASGTLTIEASELQNQCQTPR